MWEGAQVCCGAGRPRWSVERASFFCARRLRNDLERGTRARERTQADELGRTQSKERAWYTRPFLRASTTNPGGRSPRRGRGTHVLFFAPVDLEMIRREARAHASAHRQNSYSPDRLRCPCVSSGRAGQRQASSRCRGMREASSVGIALMPRECSGMAPHARCGRLRGRLSAVRVTSSHAHGVGVLGATGGPREAS